MLITSVINGQNFYESYIDIRDDSTLSFSDIKYKVDSLLYITENHKAYKDAILIAHNFSKQCNNKADFNNAIIYAKKDISYYEILNLNDEAYSIAVFNLGLFYRIKREYNNALEAYNKVIEINNNPKKIGQSYSEIARIYRSKNDFYKSLDFLYKSINVLEENKLYTTPLYDSYLDIAFVYNIIAQKGIDSKENYIKELLFIEKAFLLKKEIALSKRKHIVLFNAAANYYNNEDHYNFEKAKSYYLESIKIYEAYKDSTNLAGLYNNVSSLLIKEERNTGLSHKDSILYYLNRGLSFETSYNKSPITAIYRQFSDYSYSKKEYKKALVKNSLALKTITNLTLDPHSVPELTTIDTLKNKNTILNIFNNKADILFKMYDEKKDVSNIKLALKTLQVVDHLIDVIQQNSDRSQSKLLWRNQASLVYLRAIKACRILNKPDLAFYFIEKNKAFLLTEGIIENNAKSQLPKYLQQRKKNLQQKIIDLNTANNNNNDSLFIFKQKLDVLNDSIKIEYPELITSSNKTMVFPLNQAQEYLDAESIIISYIWNDDTGTYSDEIENNYVVLSSKKRSVILPINNNEETDSLIQYFQKSISSPFEDHKSRNSFQEKAYHLYNTLIPKEAQDILENYKNIIIVPDRKLQNISFEALITSKDTTNYFIETHRISYAYSISFLMHNASIKRNATNPFVGYAPLSFNEENITTLKKSKKEIIKINSIIEGKTFIDNEATKQNFLDHSQDAKIIHLATHADGTSNPWIAFKDEKLNAAELYIYKNQAELVTLSACNTTIGDIAPGEGVMSLARGFFYAGANTVVSSLWETNDKSTSEIMTSFYIYLKSGKSKSESLHLAKLDYIHSNELSQQSPYYWAPFILIGEGETSLFNNNFKLYIIAFIILLLLLSIYFIKKRKSLGNK